MADGVLVTGGSGFVGSRVIESLTEMGITCHSLDLKERPPGKVRSLKGDITDPGTLSFPKGLDCVVHCAGILESSHAGRAALFKVNLEGTKNVYAKAKEAGVRKFVFMSTIMAVGPQGTKAAPMTETTVPRPDEPYGESKLLAERFLMERGKEDGIDVVILRPPVIYGEGMSEHSSAMRTFRSVRKGIMPMPHRGKHTFNMLYIRNLASAITTASLSGEGGSGIFHVNEGPYTLHEVVAAISSEMGSGKGFVRIPGPALLLTALASEAIAPIMKGPPPFSMTKYRALTSDIWNIGSSRIREVLRFSPPYSLEEGVRRTCLHYGWSKHEDRRADHSSP